jgi:hypothetical protein
MNYKTRRQLFSFVLQIARPRTEKRHTQGRCVFPARAKPKSMRGAGCIPTWETNSDIITVGDEFICVPTSSP